MQSAWRTRTSYAASGDAFVRSERTRHKRTRNELEMRSFFVLFRVIWWIAFQAKITPQ